MMKTISKIILITSLSLSLVACGNTATMHKAYKVYCVGPRVGAFSVIMVVHDNRPNDYIQLNYYDICYHHRETWREEDWKP